MPYAGEKLQRFQKGMGVLSRELGATIAKEVEFINTAQGEGGVLTLREKELVAIGVALYTRCEECIAVHVKRALEVGCTRQEILEAAGMALIFGGGPVLAMSATFLIEALDEFAK